jgi:inosine/xanthosine triphosphate pyrophosphatase family protein
MRLVLASANRDKAAEIAAILPAAVPGLDLAPRPPDVPDVDETGTTLLENALPSAVPCTSTNRPELVITTFMSTSAFTSST